MLEYERGIKHSSEVDTIIFFLYKHSLYKNHGIPIEVFIEMDWPKIAPLLSKSLQHRGVPNTLLHDRVYGNQYDITGRFNGTAPGFDVSMVSLKQTAILFPTSQENNRCGLLCRPTPDLGLDHPLCIITGETDHVKTTVQQMLGGNWDSLQEATQKIDTETQTLSLNTFEHSQLSKHTTIVPAPIPPGDYYEMIAHLHSGTERTRNRIHIIASLVNSMCLMYPPGKQHNIMFKSMPRDVYQLSDIIYALQLLGNETHIEINQTGEIHIKTNPSQHYIKSEISTVRGNLEQLLKGLTNQEVIDSHLFRLLQVTDQPLVNQVNTSIRRLMQSWKNGKLSDEKNLIEALILFLETEFLKTQTDSDTYPAEDRRQ